VVLRRIGVEGLDRQGLLKTSAALRDPPSSRASIGDFALVSAVVLTAPLQYVERTAGWRAVHASLARAGLPLELAEITQLGDRFIRLASFAAFLEAAASETKQSDLGVRLGDQLGLVGLGSHFASVESAPTLRVALDEALGASARFANCMRFTLGFEAERCTVGLERGLGALPGAGQLSQMLSAAFVRTLRQFANSGWNPLSIESEPRPRVSFERHLLDGERPGGVPPRLQLAGDRSAPSDVLGVVREVVRLQLFDNDCTLKSVARALGVSTRTLQREVHAAGSTFRRLVVAERCAWAAKLLVETGSSVVDIALTSGYSSHHHLTRAFKQVQSMTPTQYRRVRRVTRCPRPSVSSA
jgi:AraC-like DNA-binding protein